MEKHFDLTDFEFQRQFENCELDPSFFSHKAHLRLAWIYIRDRGFEKAIQDIQFQLQRFVEHAGTKDKYNKTLTIAAIKAVYHFYLRSGADNFKKFICEFPQLKYNFRELISSHYSMDIYNSEKAKREFIEPDLLPFDK